MGEPVQPTSHWSMRTCAQSVT